jgi:hypothetical protein
MVSRFETIFFLGVVAVEAILSESVKATRVRAGAYPSPPNRAIGASASKRQQLPISDAAHVTQR